MTDAGETKTVSYSYTIYPSQHLLSQDEQELVQKAREAMHNAYAPYSHYHVGAALRLKDGQMIIGANQENASYGHTVCAERNALFAAGSAGKKDQIIKLAVIARPVQEMDQAVSIEQELPGSPCGACRQVIKEYEGLAGQSMTILIVMNTDRVYRFEGADILLPLAFGPSVFE